MKRTGHKRVAFSEHYVDNWRLIFSTLLAVLSITSSQASVLTETTKAKESVPKLIVGITIDQFRSDFLQYCLQSFGDKGFKVLLNEGLFYQQVQFSFETQSNASSIAGICTGTTPFYHGITANTKYNWDQLKVVPILYDARFIGNYTNETLSAANLKSSTFADELKIASNGQAFVYAIAPDPNLAILSGGHAANAAFWLEDYTGKWATTTYYKDIPWYVERYNLAESLDTRINSTQWEPSSYFYDNATFSKDNKGFKYSFYGKDKFKYFKTSALVNEEVNKLACRFIQYEDFAHKLHPSILSISFYAGEYAGSINKGFSSEIKDTYYRLDKELGYLLETLEKYVGLEKTLLFVTSTGFYETEDNYPDVIPPAGKFYPNRCAALLNMYLMSVYGPGDWVMGYYGSQIFLNRKLIEDKALALSEVQRKAAEFTIQFSGVQDVATLIDLLYGNGHEGAAKHRNGINRDDTGDLLIELQPGWLLVDEQNGSKDKTVRNNAVVFPLLFLGNHIVPQKINQTVKVEQIAPTLTHVLRIRPPNAAKERPLSEFIAQ